MSEASLRNIMEGVKAGSIAWTDFLAYSSNMFGYTFDEITELYEKAPNATAVATFEQWASLGIYVNFRAKHIGLSNGKKLFDVRQTKAAGSFVNWKYTPEAGNGIAENWSKLLPKYSYSNNDIVSNTISFCFTHLMSLKNRYNFQMNTETAYVISDSAAYTMLKRFDVDTSDYDFDFSNTDLITSDVRAFSFYGKLYRDIISGGLFAARNAIRQYEREEAQRLASAERAINDRALFEELSQELYDYNDRICKIEGLTSPNITLADISSSEQFTITLSEFEEQAKKHIANEIRDIAESEAIVSEGSSEEEKELVSYARQTSIVTLTKAGDFYEMYDKNADIGVEVLGLHLFSKQGRPMAGFPAHSKEEYSKKLSEAGYSVMIEEVFELNAPHSNQGEIKEDTEGSSISGSEQSDLIAYAQQIAMESAENPDNSDINDYVENEQLSFFSNNTPDTPTKSVKTTAPKRRSRNNNSNIEYPSFQITEQMIDEVLRCGSVPERYSLEQIVAYYQKDKADDVKQRSEFLRKLYNDYGTGIVLNSGEHIAFWCNSEGITIGAGDSAYNPYSSQFLSWEEAAKRIEALLNKGTYCSQDIIDRAEQVDLEITAEKLDSLYSDVDRKAYKLSFLPNRFFQTLYPEKTDSLVSALRNRSELQKHINGLSEFIENYHNSPEILRYRNIHDPDAMLVTLNGLLSDRKVFTADKSFAFRQELFISEEEKNTLFIRGAAHRTKFNIRDFFESNADKQERIKFIRSEYGIGGGTYIDFEMDRDHDYKGIGLSHYGRYGRQAYNAVMKWSEAADRIAALLDQGRYITEEDISDRIRESRYIVEHYTESEQDDIWARHNREEYEKALRILEESEKDTQINVPDTGLAVTELETVKTILRSQQHLKASKAEIFDYFTDNTDINSRISYLTDIQDRDVYTEILVDNVRLGYIAKEMELTVWEGSYLKRTSERTMTWDEAAEIVGEMIENGSFLDADEKRNTDSNQMLNSSAEETNTPVVLPRNNVVNVTANRNYKHLLAAFPAIMMKQYDYMQFSAGESFDKLNIEWIGSTRLALSHTYIQNGDLMRDPEIVFEVNSSAMTVSPVEYQNDSLGLYGRYEVDDANSKECNGFAANWLNNIDAQGYSLIRSVRSDSKQGDISKSYDRPLDEDRYDLIFEHTENGIEIYNRLDIINDTPKITFRKIAAISPGGGVSILYNSIPDYYNEQITAYSNRIDMDRELLSAFALVNIFNAAREGKYFADHYDLDELKEICLSSDMYDRDLKDFIDRAFEASSNIDADDYSYAITLVSDAIDNYQRKDNAERYAEKKSFILDEETETAIFSQLFAHFKAISNIPTDNDVNEIVESIIDNESNIAEPIANEANEPVVADEAATEDNSIEEYGLNIGDVVALNGSDREFVITGINSQDQTATIRDDNTGWYPLFQEVPLWKLSAFAAQNEQQHSFDPDEDEAAVKAAANYVIDNDTLGVATPKVRAANNIKAIEIINTVLKEHRSATDEERTALANYVGWGSLPDVFDERKDNFLSERDRLHELLTDKEYESARESTLTAFYTQPVIIRSIYKALQNMGFEGGKILEPAMGVGNFFGVMPQNISENSQLYGVEIDRITGNIAKQLYPNAKIAVKGFEDFNAADNSFDVVIGNVPFADFKVFDPRYNRHNLLIHDYFFAKAIDKVKPGGIVAFITSKGTLDKQNNKFRKQLCEKAELIGAVRLPSTAFKANAGTEAISDIIFLKKRSSIQAVKDNWVDVTYSDESSSYINNYFIENPDMICGVLSKQSTQFGWDIDVKPFEDVTLEEALTERISKLRGKFEPIETVIDLEADKNKDVKYLSLIDNSIPRYCYGQLSDGTIVYREGDKLRVENVSKNAVKYYQAAIRLSRAVRYIVNVQQEAPDGFNDEIINNNFERAKAELNEAYDKFAALGLRVNDTKRRSFKFTDDNNYGLMASLEEQVTRPDGTKEWIKQSDLFEKRTIVKHKEITHCDTVSDAFLVCLNTKSHIDIDYISRLTDKTYDEIITELDGAYMYRNPETYDKENITSGWETADEYLSGNIRAKLQRAKDEAQTDTAFAKNVAALENVMPENIPASDIAVQLGSSWVPVDVIRDFMLQEFELPEYVKSYCTIEHDQATATWSISNKSMAARFTAVAQIYGTNRMNGMEVLENSLNMRRCTIYDRVEDADGKVHSIKNAKETQEICLKQDALKQAFQDWVYKDAARTRQLEDIYNKLYNSERVRKFDGSHLSFDGMNTGIELKPHQKNAVARVLYGGNTLLAHVVGAGKTFEIAAACMELKRTGAANKALIVVPNHLIGQWGKEFLTLYPAANILTARSEDFAKENRRKFLGRIATGNYDAIIMGYSTFSKIGISNERRKAFYNEELETCIDHLYKVKKGSISEKQLTKYKKELEGNLKSLEYVVKQDGEITFEELGVDWLYVDEAHNFKNLQMNTKLGRVAGVQTSKSKRAEDLLLKIRYINELQGAERGVVLATGTPISNSLVEMYTMQRYLQPKYLAAKGIGHFDAWAADFAKIESSIELNPTGVGFRQKIRCSSFNNLPELMKMFNRCTDIQTADMLDLPVPKLKNDQYTICVCSPSPEQKEFVKRCGDRAEAIHNKLVSSSDDNMLCVTNDGKMCAIDMRLVDPDAEDKMASKINVAISNIYNKWKETEADRLTQIVFLDRSTPKQDEFNLYDDIRNKLVDMGIPKEEIKFIHEAKNDTEKLKLFDEVNAGQVRIIIGSTEKMGAGTNIQTKLCALHHLDVPWRPSDIEQREGRIIRRGNTCKEVEIFRYVTEETFDAYSWQTIESKSKFISQVMTGEAAGRSAEDVDSAVLNYAQLKALATGDPRIKEHFDLTEEVNKLRIMKGNFDRSHIQMRDRLAFKLPQDIQRETNFVKLFKAEKEYAAEHSKPFNDETNPFSFTIAGKIYDKREEAGQKILEITDSGAAYNAEYKLGQYRGFDLSVYYSVLSKAHVFYLRHDCTLECEVGVSSVGMFKRLDYLIDHTIDKNLAEHSQLLASAVKDLETCKQHADEPFPHKEELAAKEARLAELTKELALNESSEGDDLIESEEIVQECSHSR